MVVWFVSTFAAVVAQRLLELRLARKNAGALRKMGGYEVGADHYPQIVHVHVLFFAALWSEFFYRQPAVSLWMAVPFSAFLLLQAVRIWCIRSLGLFWNTRIMVVPGMELVRRGPYRFMKHPNYAVVTLEFLFLPLSFGCFLTAFLFPLLNVLVLRKRIAAEEAALRAASGHVRGKGVV